MEHLIDEIKISGRTGITDSKSIQALINYAKAINLENQKYNLTGHKTIENIIDNLIIGSLEPVKCLNVPRGTLFADMGTGAGIPGIPIAIKHSDSQGFLFDSNQKKVRFINKTSAELGIKNINAMEIRVEEAGRMDDYREKFNLVFTRAMSDVYTIAELGSPLLKTGGYIFLFVNRNQLVFDDYLLNHLSDVGLAVESQPEQLHGDEGLFLRKIKPIDDKFPRRMPVIKRLAAK